MASPIAKLSDDCIVIAVDFGTSCSGVSYAFNTPGKTPDVVPILEWPGLDGFRQPKVPTLILYDENDATKFKWGAQVDWRDSSVKGVKLLLDPSQSMPDFLPNSSFKQHLQSLPKDAVDVAADFIGAIYKHALSIIKSSSIREYFDLCEKEFVLSVPAVWSDKAKDLTLKAAKKAGIHPVTLIKEPEAAALYTMSSYNHSLKAGDSFVVCDAGGGTVDLITYNVTRIEPYLELSELVPGTGAMAGSMLLDKRFEDRVRLLVGDEQFATLEKTLGWAKAQNDFEKIIKTAFTGEATDMHYVNFPKANLRDDEQNGLEGNCWELTGRVLQDIFAPIIDKVLDLVRDQVKAAHRKRPDQPVKGIFLVGGFGSSRYLKKRLTKCFVPQGIQVIQPHDAWAAIVKGAALSRVANKATVISSQAVRHYGVVAGEVFDPIVDRGRPTSVCPADGITRVSKMTWYICKGEDLKRDVVVKFPFFRRIAKHLAHQVLIFTEVLQYSDTAVSPTYPGPDVKRLCSIESDLRLVDRSRFKHLRGVDGIDYFTVNFLLCISTADANLKFSLEFDGKEMGSVEATYL